MRPDEVLPFLFAILLFVLVPVVFMFLKHQQKMAELIHGRHNQALPPIATDPMLLNEIAALRSEIRELKALSHQQAIAIDNLSKTQPSVADRLHVS